MARVFTGRVLAPIGEVWHDVVVVVDRSDPAHDHLDVLHQLLELFVAHVFERFGTPPTLDCVGVGQVAPGNVEQSSDHEVGQGVDVQFGRTKVWSRVDQALRQLLDHLVDECLSRCNRHLV